MERHSYKQEDIEAALTHESPLVLRLKPGDSAWDPRQKGRWPSSIRGPKKVTYWRLPEIKVSVEPLEIAVELRDAVVTHYLATDKRAEPQDLAALLGVSESTVRKRIRALDYDVDGCDTRYGTNGRSKTSFTPTKAHLRSLLLQERGRNV